MVSQAITDAARASDPEEIYRIIREDLKPHFAALARHNSTVDVLSDPLYQSIEAKVKRVLESVELVNLSAVEAKEKPKYSFLVWNLERGIQYERQLQAFRTHKDLKDCDVLILIETDVGMARSGNRPIAQLLARELQMNYAFVPCYLNFAKGSGVEYDVGGANELGLHGNTILSRYPIDAARPVHLKNGKDKMRGREKRLGSQTALVADIQLPNFPVTVAAVHLDAHSNQEHRHDQMCDVVDGVRDAPRVIIAGDWNTMTFNSSSAFYSIMGYLLRVLMACGYSIMGYLEHAQDPSKVRQGGVERLFNTHFLHPYKWFEKQLFSMLEKRGFNYKDYNKLGERTASFSVKDRSAYHNLREWVPDWCFAFIRWALADLGGEAPLKIDWVAARGVGFPEETKVVRDLREGRQVPLSDHDAIRLDVVVGKSGSACSLHRRD